MAYLRDNSVRQFTDHKDEDFLPEFSPDGGSIAFISNRSGAFEIYIMSVETGEKRKLTSIHSDEVLNFVWSQDNKTIYVQNSPRGADRSRKIWKAAVKDGKTRKILDFKGEFAGPQWIPESLARDDERLYFIRAHSAADIWTAQLEYK